MRGAWVLPVGLWGATEVLEATLGAPGSLGDVVEVLGVPWGAPLERLRSTLTPYLPVKNDAQKNQKNNVGNAIGCPKLVSVYS